MTSAARRLASGSAMRVITLACRIAIGLFMVPFLIHGLGDRSYGLWTLVGVVVGYYGMLDLGLSEALGRYISRALARNEFDECNQLLSTALVMYSALGSTLLLVSVVLASCSSMLWSDSADAALFSPLVLILGLNLALGFPVRTFGGILQAKLRHDLASGLSLITLLLHTALVIWAVQSGYGLITLAWVSLIGGVPQKLLVVYFGTRELPSLQLSRRSVQLRTARILFSFSFFLFVARFSRLLRFQTDALILSTFAGLVAVTHYRVASTLIRYYRQLMVACLGALLPFFSAQDGRGDRKAVEQSFLLSIRVSVAISAFVSLALIAWGQAFIARWVGVAYLDAYLVLVVLSLGALISLSQSTFPTLLYASGHERMGAAFAAADGGLKLLMSVILVQGYGMLGVALGSFFSSFLVRLLIQPALGCRAMGIPYRRYILQLGGTSLRSALCLLPALGLTVAFSPSDYPSLLGVAVASGGTYLLGLWFIEFTGSERRQMLRVLNRSDRGKHTQTPSIEMSLNDASED